ncbi:MAG: histidine phosphatase family protein [Alphaproteobacteria bacterium]|nr:histidine phosphatase family protein [Alphaproteobacteria bacterium]
MPEVYLSIGRHERYGYDTAIERIGMLEAYLSGKYLKKFLPKCETIYHSPLARAAETARFQALGMECSHILQIDALDEDTPKFTVQKFLNGLLQNTTDTVRYYHCVTHLPVIEKLGLPFLAAGEICLLTAQNWQEMLSENYSLQVIKVPVIPVELWQKLKLIPESLERLTAKEIYNLVSNAKNTE